MSVNLQSWSDEIPDMVGTILAARAWCYFQGRLFPIYAGTDSHKWATYGLWFNVPPAELPKKAWGNAGTQTAECPNQVRKHANEERTPAQMCICGFWGLLDPDFLVAVLGLKSALDGRSNKLLDIPAANWPLRRSVSSFVLGTVRMWGKVIPGEAGWRSEKAQIDGIIATSHPEARKVARRYGVPTLATWPELTPAWRAA